MSILNGFNTTAPFSSPMTVEEAYKKLGLWPLDDWRRNRHKKNKHPSIYKGLGASTWMCVRAALQLDYGDILLVGENMSFAQRLATQIDEYAEKLMGIHVCHKHTIWDWECSNGTHIRLTSAALGVRIAGMAGHRGLVFNDWDWAERMKRRAQGPFAMVRFIHRKQKIGRAESMYAYAEEAEYLMELSREGAEALVAKDYSIQVSGWTPERFAKKKPWPKLGRFNDPPV